MRGARTARSVYKALLYCTPRRSDVRTDGWRKFGDKMILFCLFFKLQASSFKILVLAEDAENEKPKSLLLYCSYSPNS